MTVAKICPMCGRMHEFEIDEKVYEKVNNRRKTGTMIQEIIPGEGRKIEILREKLLSGYCEECQELLFGFSDDDDSDDDDDEEETK